MKRKLGRLFLGVLLAALILTGCQSEEDAVEGSISSILQNDGRFETMSQQFAETGELQTLRGGSFTVFAPTDKAFKAFYEEFGPVSGAELREVLRYHVVPAPYTAADIIALGSARVPTLQGSDIKVEAVDGAVILNDRVKVIQADIMAFNGVIHVIDAVLIPGEADGEEPGEGDMVSFESAPDLTTVEGDTVTDTIEIDDPRFLTDLNVTLDLEHPFVYDLIVTLEHEETGTVITLINKPFSNDSNVQTTFDDAAELSAADDVVYDQENDVDAFPEDAYRPDDPLEFFYGEALAGTWKLSIFDGVVRENDIGTLNSWSLDFTAVNEQPDPAIYLVPGGSNVSTLVPGTTEALVFNVKRLSGLEGDIKLKAKGGEGVSAKTVTITGDAEQGVLPVKVSKGASLGERTLEVEASNGKTTRSLTLDVTVAEFDKDNVELLAYLPLATIGTVDGNGNDSWGWTDPETGSDIAIMGTTTGTAFIDVSKPRKPEYLGLLPTHNPEDVRGNTWRDIKVYDNHAYVVSEAEGHGLQVFDLTQLRNVKKPQTFEETAHYDEFGNAHNIVINTDTGYAYVVGATSGDYENICSGGLHIVDINTPTSPEFVTCFSGAGLQDAAPSDAYPDDVYTHDAQCVVYNGPDEDYAGNEMCFTSDEVTIGIADVEDKSDIVQVARETYGGVAYTHQGWLTEDQRFFLVNDELDELESGNNTNTYIWNVEDLDAPELIGIYESAKDSIDHNMYVKGNYLYQTNYTSGLRVLDLEDVADAELEEVAYFDTYPEDDGEVETESLRAQGREFLDLLDADDDDGSDPLARYENAAFNGTWSNYPYFDDIVILSDIDRGLFVVRPDLDH